MRIQIKGGVWKNTEDEILKAAVMKYGKNQWARISSLLSRKSAKQCKARWYEWLDPSIKKTEWTREEEEKLLHLAKLMPTQWRTIAPIIGRTAAQCLEHYEKLLDAAQEKDEGYDPSEDPRRLRPGEIDPHPETKPARPDPIDMDEDEKEMLSEARARLANTKGKKAKRKAREKQLEEARRLAALQKKRELKAAGIDITGGKRKRRGEIDYNEEIPFQKHAPAGFYDEGADSAYIKQSSFVARSKDQLDYAGGKRRIDEEMQKRKKDMKRLKKRQDEMLPEALAAIDAMNDPGQQRKRAQLVLPAPQVSDAELDEVSRLSARRGAEAAGASGGGSATETLLADYGAAPAATPSIAPTRTPRAQRDTILTEAQNLIALTNGATPLLGDANAELHPSDFAGATPARSEAPTPNTTASSTPSRSDATPSLYGTSEGGITPMRDELGINAQPDAMIKAQVKSGLLSLPAPKNEYTINIPEEEMEPSGATAVEDAEDRKARVSAAKAAAEQAEFKLRSQPLQRGLPRVAKAPASAWDQSSLANQMVAAEIERMVAFEEAFTPTVKPRKSSRKKAAAAAAASLPPPLDHFDRAQLEEAKLLILEEQMEIQPSPVDAKVFNAALDSAMGDVTMLPGSKTWGSFSGAKRSEQVASLQDNLEQLRERMGKDFKRGAKVDTKVKMLTQGYSTRSEKLEASIGSLHEAVGKTRDELTGYCHIRELEQKALPERMREKRDAVQRLAAAEASAQEGYKALAQELKQLTE